MVALMVIVAAVAASAGVLSDAGEWFTWQAVAYILTGVLSIGGIGGSVVYRRIVATLNETGQFLTVLGTALADNQVSKEEIQKILAEGKDVLDIWRTTPERYRVE